MSIMINSDTLIVHHNSNDFKLLFILYYILSLLIIILVRYRNLADLLTFPPFT